MATQTKTPNILLIIADDLGKSNVNVTGTGATRAMEVHTIDSSGVDIIGALPNVSRLLRSGLHFPGAWAHPACSPTRASIYTGLHPWKHGVGSPIGSSDLDSGAGFRTLPNLLPSDYVSGLFGKWHLGRDAGARPTDHGWDRHIGTLGGASPDHYHWDIVDSDNKYTPITLDAVANPADYYTLRTVREAAGWINALQPATPWFATIAFNTPHNPFHVPPGGYDPATAGNPSPADPANPDHYHYLFNIMTQNTDYNIGRLLGTSGQPGGSRHFDPIAEDQLSNTIIIFISDNGSPYETSLEESKTEIYEGGVRVPMIIADGQAVTNEINLQAITPRFLQTARVNATSPEMIHVIDLYMTIVKLADPAAKAFPSNTDSKDFSGVLKNSIVKRPAEPRVGVPTTTLRVRSFNFSQLYDTDGTRTRARATIRNAAYKLNYDDTANPKYSLFQYTDGEIPGLEDGDAVDLFSDALDGTNADAQTNLNLLLDELIANYQRDETQTFRDPR